MFRGTFGLPDPHGTRHPLAPLLLRLARRFCSQLLRHRLCLSTHGGGAHARTRRRPRAVQSTNYSEHMHFHKGDVKFSYHHIVIRYLSDYSAEQLAVLIRMLGKS